jgi:hypothetical protein
MIPKHKVILYSIFIIGVFNKAAAQDKVAMFMNNGQPISSISCGNFDRLEVKFPLPEKPGSTYDRIKFVLTLGEEEYKSRNYVKADIYYYLSGKPEVKYLVLKGDSSDFTGPGNEILDMKRLCKADPNKPVTSYVIKAEARGFTMDKVNKMDKVGKKNHPTYKDPEAFVKSEINVQTLPATVNK